MSRTNRPCDVQRVIAPRARRITWGRALGGFAPLVLVVALAACTRSTPAPAAESRTAAPAPVPDSVRFDPFARGMAPPFAPPLGAAPLDTPLAVTDDFGERRGNHFHAALDLSTDGQVGKPVYAPLTGWIERARSSGGGYGRSIYLHGDDGRLIVFGHLDAFDGPLASYVDSAQTTTGQYEQDLVPAPERFRVRAGERIAWSGESGVGPPHLHVEVRHGDMALNPLRAGLWVGDDRLPVIHRIVLEPIDDRSYVNRRAVPWTWTARARDSVTIEGRFRVRVDAQDGFSNARRGDMACYDTRVTWGDRAIECRFDSVSWAGDMADVDQVFDGPEMRMWVPMVRPRVYHARGNVPWFEVASGDSVRALVVTVRDVAGHEVEQTLWVAPPLAGHAGPDSSGVATPRRGRGGALTTVIEPVGPGFVRLTARGVPRGSRDVSFELAPLVSRTVATPAGDAWAAIIAVPRSAEIAQLVVRGRAGGREWTVERPLRVLVGSAMGLDQVEAGPWRVSSGGWYEQGVLTPSIESLSGAAELRPVTNALVLGPSAPLHLAWKVSVQLTSATLPAHASLYRKREKSWDWLHSTFEPTTRRVSADTHALGRFAVMIDGRPPRIGRLRVRRGAAGAPYSRWAIESRLADFGSGIDPSGTHFEVDGVAMPSEWDLDAQALRWRPRVPPAHGRHRVRVIATDRTGNRAESKLTTVVD